MLIQALQIVDSPAATQLRKDLRDLHQGTSEGRGDPEQVARKIRGAIAAFLPKLEAWSVDPKALRALAKNVLSDASGGEYTDYAASEQAAMALQSIVYGFYADSLIDGATYDGLERNELAKILDSVDNPDTFDPDQAKQAFASLQSKLKGK